MPERDTWLMVIFEPPEFAKATDCVWLMPTATLPKLMLEGLTTSCPVPATACELNARSSEKRKSEQNPLCTQLEYLTIRPLKPHYYRAAGDLKSLLSVSAALSECSERILSGERQEGQITEGQVQ